MLRNAIIIALVGFLSMVTATDYIYEAGTIAGAVNQGFCLAF